MDIVEQRKDYYQRNKEKINRIASERYHKKKNDPAFYKNCLEKNQKAYYKKTGRADRTPEEEEEYFRKIREHVASLRDEKRPVFGTDMKYDEIHKLFFAT
jgi:hypothetical protein